MISYQKLTSSELVGIHNGQQLKLQKRFTVVQTLKNKHIFIYIVNVLYFKFLVFNENIEMKLLKYNTDSKIWISHQFFLRLCIEVFPVKLWSHWTPDLSITNNIWILLKIFEENLINRRQFRWWQFRTKISYRKVFILRSLICDDCTSFIYRYWKRGGGGLIHNLMIFLYRNWGYDHSFLSYEISFCMFYKELKQFLLPLHTAPWQYNRCSVAPSNSPRTALDQSGN